MLFKILQENYENADKLLAAINMHKKFLNLYPKAQDGKHALKSLAVDFEKIGHVATAAHYYKTFANTYPGDPGAEKAYYNTAYFFELSGNFKKAENHYHVFLKRYSRSKFSDEIYFSLANLYKERNKVDDEIYYLVKYKGSTGADPDKVLYSILRLGKLANVAKRFNKAKIYFMEAVRYYKNKEPKKFLVGEKYVAEAQFLIANMHYAKFNAIQLQLPKEKMVKRISEKIKAMQIMNNEFSKVFDYGRTKFAIAALYRIGLSYEAFSKALFNAPMPKNMTTDEIQAFKAELEDVAYPIEEKAIAAFENNIEKAAELRLGAEWARLSYLKLSKYKPKDYPLDILERKISYLDSGTMYKVD